MKQKKSLYDLLEVSQSASADTLRATWERIESKHAQGALHSPEGLSDEAHYNLLKDAFFTLADPRRRAEYDKRLNPTSSAPTYYIEAEPGLSAGAKILIALLVIGALIAGYKWHLNAEQERLRIKTEQVRAEQERLEFERQEQERQAAETAQRQAQYQEQRQAQEQRREREQAIREADNNARRLEYTQDRYRRDDERARAEEERQRRTQAWEAERNARQLESKARQLDYKYERGSTTRGGGISLQSSSSR